MSLDNPLDWSAENPLGALTAIILALFCVRLMNRSQLGHIHEARVQTIDGLRGYLAFLVFIHHCAVWHGYLQNGQWLAPRTILYANFGSSSVALFFMITGFLFYTKLIKSKKQPIDWAKLYLARAYRLIPVYVFVIILLGGTVAVKTGFTAHDEPLHLSRSFLDWLLFTIPGAPDLNGLKNTFVIVAGVTWTLPHEWKFYGVLPILSLTQGVKPHWILIVLSFAVLLVWHPHGAVLESFIAGLIAAVLVDQKRFVRFAKSPMGAWVALLAVVLGYAVFPQSHQEEAILVLGLGFFLIASGSTLFGLLSWSASRFLGEMTYSMYLLHGLVLFAVFGALQRVSGSNALSVMWFWEIVLSSIPILLGASYLSYNYLELPGMRAAAR